MLMLEHSQKIRLLMGTCPMKKISPTTNKSRESKNEKKLAFAIERYLIWSNVLENQTFKSPWKETNSIQILSLYFKLCHLIFVIAIFYAFILFHFLSFPFDHVLQNFGFFHTSKIQTNIRLLNMKIVCVHFPRRIKYFDISPPFE